MAGPVSQVGGSFAPPLSLERVEHYRDLIEAEASPEVADAMMELCDMMEKFHGVEEAKYTVKEHAKNGKAHEVFDKAYITPLSAASVKSLDPHVPYPSELNGKLGLFETIQKAQSERNSAKLEKWREQVAAFIRKDYFPDAEEYSRKTLLLAQRNKEGFDALLEAAGETKESMNKFIDTLNECQNAIQIATSPSAKPPIPRPALEDTSLRDAAFHLLWYAVSLSRDQVPFTNDMLPTRKGVKALAEIEVGSEWPVTIRSIKHKSESKKAKASHK